MSESAPGYDVFVSYNSSDRDVVLPLATKLKQRGLSVFLDGWELRPGFSAQQGLSQALESSKSVAVVVGPSGVGKWQNAEIEVAISEEIRSKWPVIPVLLPGVSVDQVPLLLRRESRIDFGHSPEAEAFARLVWGITGIKPPEFEPAEPPKLQPNPRGLTDAERAANTLKTLLRAANVTFFLGGNTRLGDPNLPPSSLEIARKLLLEASLINDEQANIVLFPIDTAASYYAIQKSLPELEGRVGDIVLEKSKKTPPVQQALARLLGALRNFRKPRGGNPGRQLIVTTNPDVMLERTLLQQGVPFTRLVQSPNSASLQINQYSSVSGGGGWVTLPGLDPIPADGPIEDLDNTIASFGRSSVNVQDLSLDKMTDPILYKLRGSYDCFGTCALSTEQYVEFYRRAIPFKFIPSRIAEIVEQTPVVLLSYSFLDPDFRLAWYALLQNAREATRDPIFALQSPCGDSWPESQLWDRLKQTTLQQMGIITTIEEAGDLFLGRLLAIVRDQTKVQ
jgi:TIR domain-containing protein/SIR2-like protein